MDAVHEGQVMVDGAGFSRKPELRQHRHNVLRAQVKMFGDEELVPEGFQRLVDGKARTIGGEFDQPACGLPDIEGIEVFAVMHVDRVVTARSQFGRLRFDDSAIGHTKGHMVDGAGAGGCGPETSGVAYVDTLTDFETVRRVIVPSVADTRKPAWRVRKSAVC
ncbi:MAG: hypothetical protein U5M53_06560 [Rhodoferax sp.]|nr:hypothetical protein [Rhodoferax sp.]